MPAATFTFYNDFREQLFKGVHDLSTHDIRVVLLGTGYTPNAETQAVYADISANEIAAGNGYTTGGIALTGEAVSQSTVEARFAHTDPFEITASGGSIAAFRYVVIMNNTPTSPADPLIGYLDYGSALTLADGEKLQIDITTYLFRMT